jgi:hypothetical protein
MCQRVEGHTGRVSLQRVVCGFVAREGRLSARRPRQGEATDGVMCCVLNKCVSGSKDTRAVCPYRRLCAVRRCSRSRNHAREALAWGSLWLAGGKKIGKRGAYLLYNVWWV